MIQTLHVLSRKKYLCNTKWHITIRLTSIIISYLLKLTAKFPKVNGSELTT